MIKIVCNGDYVRNEKDINFSDSENYSKKIYICGIKIWQRKWNGKYTDAEQEKKQIGFNKK